MEVGELVEGDLGSFGVEHEPPCVAEDCCAADVDANDHVAEEEPATNEGFIAFAGRAAHDIVVWRVERQRCGGEAIGDKVDPEKLDGDQGFRHAKGGGEEDGDDFADVGLDEVADELLRVVVDGAAFLDGDLDGGEIVICEDHVCGQFGHVGACAHSDADI